MALKDTVKFIADCKRKKQELEKLEKESGLSDYNRALYEVAKQKMDYMRLNSDKDTNERLRIEEEFANNILKFDKHGCLDLRFHATSLAATHEIIQDGGIVSAYDRIGVQMSADGHNQVSVTKIDTVNRSIENWLDIRGFRDSQPCGCLFVLQPKDKDEALKNSGKYMDNVDFVAHPEQLKAIVTTEENVEQVQQWLAEKGMNKDICHSFDDFIKVMEQERFNWIPPYQADIAEALRETLRQDDINHNGDER